jgi:hypothetical protein
MIASMSAAMSGGSPRSGFSFARRMARRTTPGTVGGRPGLLMHGLQRLPVSFELDERQPPANFITPHAGS